MKKIILFLLKLLGLSFCFNKKLTSFTMLTLNMSLLSQNEVVIIVVLVKNDH